MILLGPIVGLITGLTRLPRQQALLTTGGAALVGAVLLGLASWNDSRSLPIGFWVSGVVFLAISLGICVGVRAVKERRA